MSGGSRAYMQTKEYKDKMSRIMKGRKPHAFTPETRAKMGASQRGRKMSKETKEKMSKSQKIAQNKPSRKEEIRQQMLGNRHGAGHTPWNKGIKRPDMTGPLHFNWKGGVTSENAKLRTRFVKLYQSKVFTRDNYTCQICDQYSGYLQVDHIKSWKDYPELRFEIDNCRTLCMACHYYVTFKRKLPKGVIWGHNLSRRIESY